MQEQLIDLQSKLSFQEQSISELNDALISQQQQIDQLTRLVKNLQDQLENLGRSGTLQPAGRKATTLLICSGVRAMTLTPDR